jgi:hypothetical protein
MAKPVKHCRFREVVKDLIGFNASESEMIAVEVKLIEYAAKGDYKIYAKVLCCDWEQEFRITKEDLYCLARTPRAVLNIEELRLYRTANSAFYDYYYKRVEPDEEGIIHDCPDVSRTYPIAKDSLLISEDDIPNLLAGINRDVPFGLKDKEGDGKPDLTHELQQKETNDEYVFSEEGDIVSIIFGREKFRLKNSVGIKYIVHLLKNPSPKTFTPLKLFQEVNKVPKSSDIDNKEAVEEGLTMNSQGGNAGIYDEETKELIKKYKDTIETADATGNSAKADEASSQLEELKKEYLEKHKGRDGKSHKFPSSFHKNPYDSINNAMNRVLEKLKNTSKEKECNSLLTWKHFKNSIQFKNSHFFYNPEQPRDWQF